ncbi:MAG: hypothetical protein ACRDT2_04790 [Natronosporangium sp.]
MTALSHAALWAATANVVPRSVSYSPSIAPVSKAAARTARSKAACTVAGAAVPALPIQVARCLVYQA